MSEQKNFFKEDDWNKIRNEIDGWKISSEPLEKFLTRTGLSTQLDALVNYRTYYKDIIALMTELAEAAKGKPEGFLDIDDIISHPALGQALIAWVESEAIDSLVFRTEAKQLAEHRNDNQYSPEKVNSEILANDATFRLYQRGEVTREESITSRNKLVRFLAPLFYPGLITEFNAKRLTL